MANDKPNTAVDQMTDRVMQQQRDNVATHIDNAFQSLVVNRAKSKLPEEAFKTFFLPFFSGETNDPNLANRNPITDWIAIAGTPMAEVDIISNAGDVLFTVPPLYDTDMIDIVTRNAGQSFADVYSEYQMRKSSVPQAAANFLNNALLNKSDAIVHTDENSKTTAQRWEEIRKRYNKGSMSDGIAAKAKDSLDPDSELSYE